MNPSGLGSQSKSFQRLNPHLFAQVPCGPAVEREADLHNAIMDFCRERGWQFLHGSMAERTHRTLGEPDFVILANAGRVLFVECKSSTGKLSVEQQAFRANAEKNDHQVHIVRSMAEFASLFLPTAVGEYPKSRE